MGIKQLKESNYVFLLRHHNDIDHIAPVIWKMVQVGHTPRVIVMDDDFKIGDDRILVFLRKIGVPVDNYIDLLIKQKLVPRFILPRMMRWSKRRTRPIAALLRRLLYSDIKAMKTLVRVNCQALIFEYNEPLGTFHADFFRAAKSYLNLPTICLPHGLNICLNWDLTNEMRQLGIRPDFSRRTSKNGFDLVVFQSEYHRKNFIFLGMDAKKTIVLGSARYCPEWHQVHKDIHDMYIPVQKIDRARANIVLMLTQWNYNVNEGAVYNILRSLAQQNINLVIKSHPRPSGRLSESFVNEIKDNSRVIVENNATSVSLIKWADIVINFGSSIALEALLQEKALIAPEYLHANETIIKKTGAAAIANDKQAVLDLISAGPDYIKSRYSQHNIDELFKVVVYGDNPRRDVMNDYVDVITKLANRSQPRLRLSLLARAYYRSVLRPLLGFALKAVRTMAWKIRGWQKQLSLMRHRFLRMKNYTFRGTSAQFVVDSKWEYERVLGGFEDFAMTSFFDLGIEPNKDVFYEIGACNGMNSLLMSKMLNGAGLKVVAFEPEARNISAIMGNLLLNKANSMMVLPIALSNRNEHAEFYLDHQSTMPGQGGHSLETYVHAGSNNNSRIIVPLMTLDTAIEVFNLPAPTLISMDVEGHELNVLKGMTKTLSSGDIRAMVIEMDRITDPSGSEVTRLLSGYGFKLQGFRSSQPGVRPHCLAFFVKEMK